MGDIRHMIQIKAPAEKVFEAVSTCRGVSQWWTPRVEGDHHEGGSMTMRFGDWEGQTDVLVEERKPNERVLWKVISNNEGDQWPGTSISFDLEETDGVTTLRFAHTGWREVGDYFAGCNFFWGHFMRSIQSLAETGKGMAR